MQNLTETEAREYASNKFVKPIQWSFATEAEAIDAMNEENKRNFRIAEHARVFEYENGWIMEYLGDYRYYAMGNKILKNEKIFAPKEVA
jgi:hypothetical protein